jgi:hypothetical protein
VSVNLAFGTLSCYPYTLPSLWRAALGPVAVSDLMGWVMRRMAASVTPVTTVSD